MGRSIGFENMKKYSAATDNIDTKDILYSLTGMVPVATEQFVNRSIPGLQNLIKYTGNVLDDARYFGLLINQNIEYKEDGLIEQIIQTPQALFTSKIGDCKSFALALSGYLTAGGYKNGFRFVSFTPAGDFTHVYNFVIDNEQNIHTFDSCLRDLKERGTIYKQRDMEVSIIGSTPFVHNRNNAQIGAIGAVNRIFMAPARNAFLALIRLNYRGNATAMADRLPANAAALREFWQDLGGDYTALVNAIEAGKNKIPLMGRGDGYDEAFANSVFAQIQAQQDITQLMANAIASGFNPPFNPLNLSNVQHVQITILALQDFFTNLGNAVMNQAQSANTGAGTSGGSGVPFMPGTTGQNLGEGKGGTKGLGEVATASVSTIVGLAIPILLLVPGLLRSLGVQNENVLNTADSLAVAAGGTLPPGDTEVVTDSGSDSGSLFSNPLTWLGLGVGAYLIFK